VSRVPSRFFDKLTGIYSIIADDATGWHILGLKRWETTDIFQF
jgi:hypothetical protein